LRNCRRSSGVSFTKRRTRPFGISKHRSAPDSTRPEGSHHGTQHTESNDDGIRDGEELRHGPVSESRSQECRVYCAVRIRTKVTTMNQSVGPRTWRMRPREMKRSATEIAARTVSTTMLA
jgi:hypothetical protein